MNTKTGNLNRVCYNLLKPESFVLDFYYSIPFSLLPYYIRNIHRNHPHGYACQPLSSVFLNTLYILRRFLYNNSCGQSVQSALQAVFPHNYDCRRHSCHRHSRSILISLPHYVHARFHSSTSAYYRACICKKAASHILRLYLKPKL